MKKFIPFPFQAENRVVMNDFMTEVSDLSNEFRKERIDERNVQILSHGRAMQSHNSSFPDSITHLKQFSHYVEFSNYEIIDGDLNMLFGKVDQLALEMQITLMKTLYETVSNAAESVGNAIDRKGKSMAEAVYESLESVEFGVDRKGKASKPEFHFGSEAFEAFENDPLRHDPAFLEKYKRLIDRKQREALDKEKERLSKFIQENN